MTIESRSNAIARLEEVRGSRVLTYVTSTRGGLEAQMSLDVIPQIYKHLQLMTGEKVDRKIDLFIHSNGGDGIVPWRLVTLLREFASEFNLLVPHHAFSAATLTALGADNVIMHPMGMLGPTDPSINGPFNPPNPLAPGQTLAVSVEDVASYIALVKDEVGISAEAELTKTFLALAEKVHPLALGTVKRTTSQSRMLGEKLLRRRNDPLAKESNEELVRRLTSELFYHGHPINSREAQEDLGMSFVSDASGDEASAMWQLYLEYSEELEFEQPFNPLDAAKSKASLGVPPIGSPAVQATVKLDPLIFAMVESRLRSDSIVAECEITIARDPFGNYSAGAPQTSTARWRQTKAGGTGSDAAGSNTPTTGEETPDGAIDAPSGNADVTPNLAGSAEEPSGS